MPLVRLNGGGQLEELLAPGRTPPHAGLVRPFRKPHVREFTAVNAGSGFLERTRDGSLRLWAPGAAASQLLVWTKPDPSGSYTVTVCLTPCFKPPAGGQYPQAGICWRSSADGLLTTFGVFADGDAAGLASLTLSKYDSPTAFNAAYLPNSSRTSQFAFGTGLWLRLRSVATGLNRRYFYVSPNGLDWQEWHNVSATDFHTPDQWGLFAESGAADLETLVRYHSIEEAP